MTTDKKKYNKMEEVLKRVNKKYVTVKDEKTKIVNPVLIFVVSKQTCDAYEISLQTDSQ